MSTLTQEQQDVVDRIKEQVDNIERIGQYTLADAIREGAQFTEQAHGWGDGDKACALHAAALAAKARGYVS